MVYQTFSKGRSNRCDGKEGREEEKDEVGDDDGEAAEGWKGTSQMQEGAGGLFWVPGEQKTWEKYGETGRGENHHLGGEWTPELPQYLLCRTARTRALLTRLIVPSTYIVWSCTNGANRIEQAQQQATGLRDGFCSQLPANSRWSREPGRPRAACVK